MVAANLLHEAHAIGRRIAGSAGWQHDACCWLQPDGTRPMEGDIYEGTAGVAWFLAQLAVVTQDGELTRSALGAARHALRHVGSDAAGAVAGFHSGSLGSLWAAAHVGMLLGVDELVERAGALALGKADRLVPAERVADIVAGDAGTLLALNGLTHYDRRLLVPAVALGERLDTYVAQHLGGRMLVRQPTETRPAPGLAHGVSGAALALMELWSVSGVEAFRRAAQSALRYERGWFDHQANVWRDPETSAPLSASWCSGSVGLGVVRLRAAELLGQLPTLAEAGAALAGAHLEAVTTLRSRHGRGWEQSNCSVCHGTLGLADLLLYAAESLVVEAHRSAALQLIEHSRAMATHAGDWPCGTLGGRHSIGLMLGIAGIGAVLLRAAIPSAVAPVSLLVYSISPRNGGGSEPASG